MSRKFPKEQPDFSLTKQERKLLKDARKLIKNKLSRYICSALSSARIERVRAGKLVYDDGKVVARLKAHIMTCLDGRSYLDSWQYAHGMERTKKQRRKDRIAWIDHLLKN
jgi:hypothetical protein